MAFAEYPKAVYLDGWGNLASYRRVSDATEEAIARAEGYKTLPEWPHPDTFGKAQADETPATVPTASSADDRAAEYFGASPPPKPDRFAAARAAKAAKRG